MCFQSKLCSILWSNCRLKDLTSQTHLGRRELSSTFCSSFSANSPCSSHWHASPSTFDWQAMKLPNSCSGWSAKSIFSKPEKILNSKRNWKFMCLTNAKFTNKIFFFLSSENTLWDQRAGAWPRSWQWCPNDPWWKTYRLGLPHEIKWNMTDILSQVIITINNRLIAGC